jgi:hypothetical protein
VAVAVNAVVEKWLLPGPVKSKQMKTRLLRPTETKKGGVMDEGLVEGCITLVVVTRLDSLGY